MCKASTAELPDFADMGIKVAYIKNQIVCLQINQVYAQLSQKWQNSEQFRTKCCVLKIVATLTLASTDVFLIKMWQESYNRRESWVFEKKIVGKWVKILRHQVIIIENRRSLLLQ